MVDKRLAIYVGLPSPEELQREADLAALDGVDAHAEGLQHPLVRPDFPWPDFVELRWRGTYTSDCPIALIPDREAIKPLLEGAVVRGEPALVVAEISGRLSISNEPTMVGGQTLPPGVNPRVVEGLNREENDLAHRILQTAAADDWHLLTLSGHPERIRNAKLIPLLTEARGKPVAAIWLPTASASRWYLVPGTSKWESIVEWVIYQELPRIAPQTSAGIRALAVPEDRFVTRDEREATRALEDHDARVDADRRDLKARILEAKQQADKIREPLLYGSADALKRAVHEALAACGLHVEDLDESLGDTLSGDLLVEHDGKYWLIEVTSASGAPKETEVAGVNNHLRKWSSLGRQEGLEGAILLINHHRNSAPGERPDPYTNRGFIEALPEFGIGVISTLALLGWWASGDCGALAEAIIGPARQFGPPREDAEKP